MPGEPCADERGSDAVRSADERGSGTVLVAGVVLALAMVTAAVLVVVGYLASSSRVRTVADLVALSGAAGALRGEDPCGSAATLARSNGVRLVGCRVAGDSLDFVVSATVEQPVSFPLLPGRVRATAHAGRLGLL